MRHDPLTYIGPDRQNQAPANLPIPVGCVHFSPYFHYLVPFTYSRKNAPCEISLFLTARIFMNMAHVPPRFYNQHQQLMADAANKTSAPPPSASSAKRVGLTIYKANILEFNNVRKFWAPYFDNDPQVPGKRRGESQLSQGNSQGESQGYSQGPFTQVPLHIICFIKTSEDETIIVFRG